MPHILGPDGKPIGSAAKSAPQLNEVMEFIRARSKLLSESKIFSENPDDLLCARNESEDFYTKMMRDPELASAIERQVFTAVQGDDSIISPFSELGKEATDPAKEQAAFLMWAFDNTADDYPFAESIQNVMLGGKREGWSLSEMNFHPPTSQGRWGDKVGLHSIKTKDVSNWDLITDDFYNALGVSIRDSLDDQPMIPLGKAMIYSHRKLFEHPAGMSIMRRAFRGFFLKDNAFRFWAIFAEKFGLPFLKGSYDTGRATKAQIDEFNSIIKHWRADMGIVVPPGFDLEIISAAAVKGGSDVFNGLIDKCDQEMLVGVLGAHIQVKGGAQDQQRGSAQVGKGIEDEFTAWQRKDALRFVNFKVIPMLIDLNFGFQPDGYPFMEYPVDKVLPTKDELEGYKFFVRSGVKLSKSWLKEKHGIIEAIDDEDALEIAEPPPSPFPPDPRRGGEDDPNQLQETIRLQTPTKAEKDAEIDTLFKRLDIIEENSIDAFERVLEFVKRSAVAKASKILGERGVKRSEDLKLISRSAANRLETVIENSMLVAAGWAVQTGTMELENKGLETKLQEPIAFPDPDDLIEMTSDLRRITPRQVINAFEGRTAMSDEAFRKLLGKQRRAAFSAAGQSINVIENDLQPLLRQGLREGWSVKRFADEADSVLDPLTGNAGVVTRRQHAKTIFRNATSAAANDARLDLFDDVGDFVPAVTYSAVVDDRTTDFCIKWNGVTLLRTDPLVRTITPPNHHG